MSPVEGARCLSQSWEICERAMVVLTFAIVTLYGIRVVLLGGHKMDLSVLCIGNRRYLRTEVVPM